MSTVTPEVYTNPIARELTVAIGLSESQHLELEEACASRLYYIGSSGIADYYRVHSGEVMGDEVYKGGTRVGHEPVEGLPPLGYDMLLKGDEKDLGGKTLIRPKGILTENERLIIPVEYARFMVNACFAGSDIDIPGADSGFVAPDTDEYAREYHRLVPDDPYWLASISSKSPEFHGLRGRLEATGRGVYATLHAFDEYFFQGNMDRPPRSVALEGMGAVGGASAMYASRDDLRASDMPQRFKVDGFSDKGGALMVMSDPEGLGMVVTEKMFKEICANRNFKGNKILALKKAIEAEQPNVVLKFDSDPKALYTRQYDYFIPATTMHNSVNEENVDTFIEMIGIAQIEGGNDVTTPGAARAMADAGVTRIPDFVSNQQGVMGSGDEIESNIAEADAERDGNIYVPPSKILTLARVDDRQIATMKNLFDLYENLRREGGQPHLTMANAAKVRRLSHFAISRGIVSKRQVPEALAA